MKVQKLIKKADYIFSANERTIMFTNIVPEELSNVLVITNVTSGKIIFNFGCEDMTGILDKNLLTLTYDTSDMLDTDELKIIIDAEEEEEKPEKITYLLKRLIEEQKITNAYLAMHFDSEIKIDYLN
jgi:hypothetical protein